MSQRPIRQTRGAPVSNTAAGAPAVTAEPIAVSASALLATAAITSAPENIVANTSASAVKVAKASAPAVTAVNISASEVTAVQTAVAYGASVGTAVPTTIAVVTTSAPMVTTGAPAVPITSTAVAAAINETHIAAVGNFGVTVANKDVPFNIVSESAVMQCASAVGAATTSAPVIVASAPMVSFAKTISTDASAASAAYAGSSANTVAEPIVNFSADRASDTNFINNYQTSYSDACFEPSDSASARGENIIHDVNGSDVRTLEEKVKILRMQREMLELKKQISSLETNENDGSALRQINFEELDAAVPKFSGDNHYDINRWFLQFEDYTSARGYKKREMCLGIRRRLEGTAKDFVMNLGLIEYESMKASLIRMFRRTVTRQEIYRQLRLRTLKSTESCISYVVAMQSIAAKSDINEQELVDIIIDGIPDNSNNVKILYGARSIDELIERMDRYEQRRQRSIISRPNQKNSNANAVATTVVAAKEIRCFNCSQFVHYQSACPKPLRPPGSCFTCHQMGHFHKDCPKMKRQQSRNIAVISSEAAEYDDESYVRVMQTSD